MFARYITYKELTRNRSTGKEFLVLRYITYKELTHDNRAVIPVLAELEIHYL